MYMIVKKLFDSCRSWASLHFYQVDEKFKEHFNRISACAHHGISKDEGFDPSSSRFIRKLGYQLSTTFANNVSGLFHIEMFLIVEHKINLRL